MKRLLLAIALLVSPLCFGGSWEDELVLAALDRSEERVIYDGSYVSIPYPNDDVLSHIGVCADVPKF